VGSLDELLEQVLGEHALLLLDLGLSDNQVVGFEFMTQGNDLLSDVAMAHDPFGCDAPPCCSVLGSEKDECTHLVHLLGDRMHATAGRVG
jgi:hypothetical protein